MSQVATLKVLNVPPYRFQAGANGSTGNRAAPRKENMKAKSKTPSPTWKHLSICFTKPIWSKNRYTIDELSMGHTRNAMMVKIYRRFSWDGHRSSSTRSRGPKRWSDKSPRCGFATIFCFAPFWGRTSKNIEEHKSSQSSICSRHSVYQSKAYPFACEHSEATFKCFCQVSSQTLREWHNKT